MVENTVYVAGSHRPQARQAATAWRSSGQSSVATALGARDTGGAASVGAAAGWGTGSGAGSATACGAGVQTRSPIAPSIACWRSDHGIVGAPGQQQVHHHRVFTAARGRVVTAAQAHFGKTAAA